MDEQVSFRDFAGAVMGGKMETAAGVLVELLRLEPSSAAAAAAHFAEGMRSGGPDFMMKAMGLRTAVTSRDDGTTAALLGDCFGLQGDELGEAVAALRARYG
jgi:hypothetical protein